MATTKARWLAVAKFTRAKAAFLETLPQFREQAAELRELAQDIEQQEAK